MFWQLLRKLVSVNSISNNLMNCKNNNIIHCNKNCKKKLRSLYMEINNEKNNHAPHPHSARCLPIQCCISLNVVFFKIYQLPSTLLILILQLRKKLVRFVMQFIMANIQIVYKLQLHMKFLLAGYKDAWIEAHQKVHKQLPIKSL